MHRAGYSVEGFECADTPALRNHIFRPRSGNLSNQKRVQRLIVYNLDFGRMAAAFLVRLTAGLHADREVLPMGSRRIRGRHKTWSTSAARREIVTASNDPC